MYKLIASDLDGTLLNPQHRISEATREVVERCREQGDKFVIATGRHYLDVKEIAKNFSFPMYLITSNGAQAHNKDGEILYSSNLDQAQVSQLLELSKPFKSHRNLYTDDAWFVEEVDSRLETFHTESGFAYQLTSFDTFEHSNVLKLFFVGDHDELMNIEAAAKAVFGESLNIAFSLPHCLEVMNVSANKGIALSKVVESKGLSLQDCIAFGDGFNDKEMLEVAGKGIVMENAHYKLKEALPYLERTKSNTEDGVAWYLNQHQF
ncbi:Cof-type HAD-IIB family hydrolase [Alginatibacterium sediminis]|uniref:Cof-type HAD-IIB family hydrolase n=1 Tax=Alginatibacterium sediminis TaxID=2164068 RepID=A0A420EN95_9ALTE|nr:Cof-type HAD-IIB family hydrolase [Alginatibacterium sediminis]RKF22182.1 Cof-type HAD-IIB family hydrolase [Alginatibacterium sediminis]